MVFRGFWLVFIWLLLHATANGQTTDTASVISLTEDVNTRQWLDGQPWNIVARAEYGFIIPHRPGMRHLVTGHTTTVELDLEINSQGRKAWETLYRLPEYGLAGYYVDFGNPEVLGKAFGLVPYINFPLLIKDRFQWKLRLGSGLAWHTKFFNQDDNHTHVAIGSNLNALVAFLTEAEYRISNDFSLSTGLSFNHFSNSAASTPNLGLNVPSLVFSVTKHFSGVPENTSVSRYPVPLGEFSKSHRDYLNFVMGYKELYPAGGRKYLIYALSYLHRYQYSRKSAWLGGVDVMYNSSLPLRYENLNDTEVKNDFSMTQVGIQAGYAQLVGDLDISLSAGYYLISKFRGDGNIYSRLGVRYYLNDRWHLHTALKAHAAKADYFEYGFGYRLK